MNSLNLNGLNEFYRPHTIKTAVNFLNMYQRFISSCKETILQFLSVMKLHLDPGIYVAIFYLSITIVEN